MAVRVLTTFPLLDPSATRSCPATWATTRWTSPLSVKSSTIYGGGGFLYDTSLDGADSIEIGGSFTLLCCMATVVMTASISWQEANLKSSTVYGGQGADLIESQSGFH